MPEQTPDAPQAVGTVFILYGEAHAVNSFGQTRTLSVNDPIYADEQVITGIDGKMTIHFDNAGSAPLDIGRSTEFTIDQDVYLQTPSEDLSEVTSSVEEMQAALENQDFDPTTAFEAPASGNNAAAAGGGIYTAVFDYNGHELTPDGFSFDTDGFDSGSAFDSATHLGFDAPDAPFVPVEAPTTAVKVVQAPVISEPVAAVEAAPTVTCLENVQTSFIYEDGNDSTTTTVDYWYFSTSGAGEVTINLLSELSGGSSWVDINGDGIQDGLDTMIQLFNNDGSLDSGDWITGNDDYNLMGEAAADGSTHSFDSFLQVTLAEGNYVLAVSNYYLSTSEAVSGVNTQSSTWNGGGPYQITFDGDVDLTFGPNCPLPEISINDATAQESLLTDYDPTEGSALITEFDVTATSSQFSFDYNFSTLDYMPYNDFAFVSIDGERVILSDVSRVDTDGSGGTVEETGLQHYSISLDAGQHSVTFGVLDDTDTSVFSTLTISNQMLGGEALSPDNTDTLGDVTLDESGATLSNAGAVSAVSTIETAMDTSLASQGIATLPTDLSIPTPYEDSTAEFTVSIDEAVPYDVTVDYTTNDGSATAGSDYVPDTGTVTIAAGETEATIQIATLPDADTTEGTETFTVDLSNPDGAIIDDGTGDGEILDSLVGTP